MIDDDKGKYTWSDNTSISTYISENCTSGWYSDGMGNSNWFLKADQGEYGGNSEGDSWYINLKNQGHEVGYYIQKGITTWF